MRRAMLVPGVLATVLAGVGLRGGGSVLATVEVRSLRSGAASGGSRPWPPT